MDRFEQKSSPQQYLRARTWLLGLLLGMFCLLVLILVQWNNLHQKDRILHVSLLALSVADYGGSRPTGQVQVIRPAIVEDKMKDADLQPGDLTFRLATVSAALLSPVPSATPFYSLKITPSSTWTLTLERFPHPTSTPAQTHPPTATQVLSASNTPAVSQTFPPLTVTAPVATDTVSPVQNPTETMSPDPLPTYTPTVGTTTPPLPTPTNPHPIHPPQPTSHPQPTKHPKPTKRPHSNTSQSGVYANNDCNPTLVSIPSPAPTSTTTPPLPGFTPTPGPVCKLCLSGRVWPSS